MLTKEIIEQSIAGIPKQTTVTETPAATPDLYEGVKNVHVDVPPVKETKTETTATADTPQSNSDLQALLKELNIGSVDELKKKFTTPTEVKEPKKSKEQELSEALDFGVRNQKLKLEDYNKAVQLQGIPPKELVFKKFSETLKEKNPKITDEQIQAKFDRKYGEEVESNEFDEVGNPKKMIAYDEDELQFEAENIIKQSWQPIESIKKEYATHTETQNFVSKVQKEASDYASQIPSTIKLSIGEDSIDYAIDEKTKEKIADEFSKAYISTQIYLKDKGKTNENFNFAATLENVVWGVARNNIIGIYASNKAEQTKHETLKPFANAVTQPLETLRPDAVKKPIETIEQIADRFAKKLKGF